MYPDPFLFAKQYAKDIKKPLILGYYTHLLADYFWNCYTIKTHLECIEEIKSNRKRNDFKIFGESIKKDIKIPLPSFQEEMLQEVKKIRGFTIKKEDLLQIMETLRQQIQQSVALENNTYQLFSEAELLQKREDCFLFIQQNLKDIIS